MPVTSLLADMLRGPPAASEGEPPLVAAVSPVMIGWMDDRELNRRARHGLERLL